MMSTSKDKEKKEREEIIFSEQLQSWLDSPEKKTIAGLEEIFDEKSFALAFFLLLSIPALPLPTGGVTHVFEIIAMLLALELIAQRSTIWLPKRWRNKELGEKMLKLTLPRLIKIVKKIERFSKPRMSKTIDTRIFRTLFGISVLLLSIVAFVAPPFSGLDTLPSIGVLGISLGVILGDMFIVIAGAAIGTLGSILSIGFGAVVVEFFKRLF
ncbi:MAG: exopolysaccharide biosynthesis protein [Acidimicrobiia bacterium]